jgi:hypothetical protein
MTGLTQALEQFERVALEVTERADVVGKIEHDRPHQICIEFDDPTIAAARSTAEGLSLKLSLPAPKTGPQEPTAAKSLDRGSD